MQVDWIAQRTLDQACPVCGSAAPKPARLMVDAAFPARPRLTLMECPDCATKFYDDLSPPQYEDDSFGAEPAKFYVELGAAIDAMVEPLFQLEPARIRRYLEVGCGFGFSLDFARYAFGWVARGMDPSAIAAAGREALGVDIVPAYLRMETDLGGEPYDLVLCSEVIEHVTRPRDFLAVVRRALAPDGALLLTTPNAALVGPGTPAGALLPILQPSFHMILFSKQSLERVLRESGFSHVRVWEHANTLHALAAHVPYPLRERPVFDRALFRRYLAERAASARPDSPVANGFNYRLFKECVNAGDFAAAAPVFDALCRSYRKQFDIDLARPSQITLDGTDRMDFAAFAPRYPFNLCSVLYFQGMTELIDRRNDAAAVAYFRAAARAGIVVRRKLHTIFVDDGETENLTWRSRMHAVIGLATINAGGAVVEAERLDAEAAPGDAALAMARVPTPLATEVRIELYVRLVNLGAYEVAARLAPLIAAALGLPEDTLPSGTVLAKTDIASLNAAFCLGTLALNHRGDRPAAAALFNAVYRACEARCRAGEIEPPLAGLLWNARFHEALALHGDGEREAASAITTQLTGADPAGMPEIPPDLRGRARELAARSER